MIQTQENGEKKTFWACFRATEPKFRLSKSIFKNLASSVTRCHGQLASCTILGKAKDPILRKLSDGQTDRQTDRWTDRQTRGIS